MEKLAKYNINFIVAAISSVVIILMAAYMLVDINAIFMRILIFLEFLCSFYFVCIFFYRLQRYSRLEMFFYLIIYIIPFILSIFGLFYAFNFFSLNRIFLRENIIANILTRAYHILFIFYITHIIYFFYLFTLENKNTFYSLISSYYIVMISTILAVIFIVLYSILNWMFNDNIVQSYKNMVSDIIYEAETTFYKETGNDTSQYENFATIHDIALLYYDNELKFKSENWDKFETNHLLFETSIIQGSGFFAMISGKKFTYPYYMFILIYTIVMSVVLTISILFFKLFLQYKFNNYINIMLKGYEEDAFIYAIDTENMNETEIKRLAELYNKKFLTYKYRERYIKSFK